MDKFPFLSIFNFAMAAVYLGLGIFLLAGRTYFLFTPFQQTAIGIILAVYGIFRVYMTLRRLKENKTEEEDNEDI